MVSLRCINPIVFHPFCDFFLKNLAGTSEHKLNIWTRRMIFSKSDGICPEVNLLLVLIIWFVTLCNRSSFNNHRKN